MIECIFLLNSIRKPKWEQIVFGRSIITWEFQCNEPFEELHETVSTDELCAHIFECLCWVWNNMIYTIIIYSVLVSSLQAHQAHRLFHIVVRQNTEVHSFHVGFTGYFFFLILSTELEPVLHNNIEKDLKCYLFLFTFLSTNACAYFRWMVFFRLVSIRKKLSH